MNVINKTETVNMIKEAYYINERRWNVKLYNDILLNLSEINIEESQVHTQKLLVKILGVDNPEVAAEYCG